MGTEIKYQLIFRSELEDSHRQIVAKLLEEQGKVNPPYKEKANKCSFICIVTKDEIPIALGAIKNKTESDFSEEKANLPGLANKFDEELGYIYVKRDFEGKGIASNIIRLLLEQFGDGNLMASTEITANPGMVKILERSGFRHYGRPYKSSRPHGDYIGLFLRFK